MIWKEAVKYANEEERIIEYTKKDVEGVEEHKKRITNIARELRKRGYDNIFAKKIQYAILNMLIDTRLKEEELKIQFKK